MPNQDPEILTRPYEFNNTIMRRAKALAAVATERRRLGQRVGTDNHRSTDELEQIAKRLVKK